MASVLIIFGSTGGNTELVCDEVSQILSETKHKVTVQRAEKSIPSDIKKYNYCILAGSTYGQGLLQEDINKFIKQCSPNDFLKRKFAIIGLGDNKYNTEYVIESAKILEKTVTENGGILISPTLRINKTPVVYIETTIKTWAENLSKQLK
ncbi:hypothetical protein C0416_00070 [bacterium]|nr:hypothetical protein [bacterium]